MTVNFQHKLRILFQQDDHVALAAVWQNLTKEERDWISFSTILTGVRDIRNLPLNSARFFLNTCPERFVEALSVKFCMAAGNATDICGHYCRLVPALTSLWCKHFGVASAEECEKADETRVLDGERLAIVEKACKKILFTMSKRDYVAASKCMDHLSNFVECCAFFDQ